MTAIARKFLVYVLAMLLMSFVGVCEAIKTSSHSSAPKDSGVATFDKLVQNSQKFHASLSFPMLPNRIATIAGNDVSKKNKIAQQAQDTRPIIDQSVIRLINDFLAYKKQHGSAIEKSLYASLNEHSFVDRLLVKRPLMFMTESDSYYLRNGRVGDGGFDDIGTKNQKAPLILSDYLSYDEMQIAALLGVSVPTMFINNGSRNNMAQVGQSGSYQEEGVYTALVGARFERPGLMEWQHMIITPEQNTIENGYGGSSKYGKHLISLWSKLYGTHFPTFEQAQADKTGRYVLISNNRYFDTLVYKKRMKLVLEPFLVDANERGKKNNKKVYCHAVGLGLGVWQVYDHQSKYMLEAYADIIRSRNLSWISDIDFSWFPANYQSCGGVGDLGNFKTKTNNITIHFSQRNPADRLAGVNVGKLLVAMYAWDGNAYPGNEYWQKMWSASGDPAAACCSTISELQNPLINFYLSFKKLFIVKKQAAGKGK